MRRNRRGRYGRKRDALGRDISKPHFYKNLPNGQQCDCDVDEWNVLRSKQQHGHSDSLVKYMKCSCPECGEEFAWSDYIVEG